MLSRHHAQIDVIQELYNVTMDMKTIVAMPGMAFDDGKDKFPYT